MNKKFSGGWTALVTPFTSDYAVDWTQLERNVMFQLEQGINGVLPMGTTGESATVTHNEHSRIISKTIEYVGDRCGVLAGTGSNSTDEALFETKLAVEAGVKTCLLVDCYYNKPSSLELRREYYEVLFQAYPNTDFIAYAIPGRSVTEINPYDIALMRANYSNFVAVKEASGNFERMRLTRELVDDDYFNILSGDDPNTLSMISDETISSSGVISVISNICPASVKKLCALALDGKFDEAKKIDDELSHLFNLVGLSSVETIQMPNGKSYDVTYKFPNPLPVKAMMEGLGMMNSRCKRPMGRMTSSAVETVRNALKTVWVNSPEHLLPIEHYFDVDLGERLNDDDLWEPISY